MYTRKENNQKHTYSARPYRRHKPKTDNDAFIFLDQEKAFDRISHKFMLKTLKAFGFGENFIKWVKIVYTDTKSQVKVNGFLKSDFSIQRGVRQVMGIAIRNNKNIKGYKYYGTKEHKVHKMQMT